MEKQLKDLCTKSSQGSDLTECLSGYTKPQLKELLGHYGKKMPSAAKKQEMVDAAKVAIMENTFAFFSDEKNADALILVCSLMSSPRRVATVTEVEDLLVLRNKGVVFLTDVKEAAETVIPSDIAAILTALVRKNHMPELGDARLRSDGESGNVGDPKGVSETEDAKFYNDAGGESVPEIASQNFASGAKVNDNADSPNEVKSYSPAATNGETPEAPETSSAAKSKEDEEIIFYAVALANICGVCPLTHLKAVWNRNHYMPVSLEKIKSALEKAECGEGFYIEGKNIVNSALGSAADREKLMERYHPADSYYFPSLMEINAYKEDMMANEPPEYIYLRSFFRRKAGVEKADEIMRKLHTMALCDATPGEVTGYLTSVGAGFKDMDELNRFFELYTGWFYRLRVWACKGNMPMETAPESLAARNFTFTSDMAHVGSRKIGRNDRCPCGSGKKYKNCCLPLLDDLSFKSEKGR